MLFAHFFFSSFAHFSPGNTYKWLAAQEGEACAPADGDNGLTDTNLQSVSGPEIGRVAHDDEPGELKIITGRQNQKASLCRRASGRQMLRLNLIAARNPGNDGARNERPRDNPGFLRVAPAPPSAAVCRRE